MMSCDKLQSLSRWYIVEWFQQNYLECTTCKKLQDERMADLIKMASEYGLRVIIEAHRPTAANNVLYKLKNSEIEARVVLIP